MDDDSRKEAKIKEGIIIIIIEMKTGKRIGKEVVSLDRYSDREFSVIEVSIVCF